jgi:methylated-DNA-[protein]-cysteine S-methyltransferase
LWFAGQKYGPSRTDAWHEEENYPVFESLRGWLSDYFAGQRPRQQIALKPRGTAFQLSVYDALLKIPYGQLSAYGGIAKHLGCNSARAVGGAIGHNPISILIPCHRVVGANGNITGYAGGIDKKQALLKIEGWDGTTNKKPTVFP